MDGITGYDKRKVLVATRPVYKIYERAHNLDSLIKFQQRQLDPLKDRLKEVLGPREFLVTKSGILLATYTEQAKKKGDCFDFERFCADHPDLWEEYKRPPFTMRSLRIK